VDIIDEKTYNELLKGYDELTNFEVTGKFTKERFIEMVEYLNSDEYDKMLREANTKPIVFCETREWYRNNKQFCLDSGMSEEEYNERFGE